MIYVFKIHWCMYGCFACIYVCLSSPCSTLITCHFSFMSSISFTYNNFYNPIFYLWSFPKYIFYNNCLLFDEYSIVSCAGWLLLTWYNLKMCGTRDAQQRNCCLQTGVWACLWDIFLMANWWRTQATVGGATLGQVARSYIRSITESEPGEKTVNIPAWSLLQ